MKVPVDTSFINTSNIWLADRQIDDTYFQPHAIIYDLVPDLIKFEEEFNNKLFSVSVDLNSQ